MGGTLYVLTLWNWVPTRCFASRPDTEMRSYIVHTLPFWFIDGDIASYWGSSELLKIWCWIQVISTHLLKCYLYLVRKALKRNSTMRIRLLEGNGIDDTHWWRLEKNHSFVFLNLCQKQVIRVKYEIPNRFMPPLPPSLHLINVICGNLSLSCSQEFCTNKQWLSCWSADWNTYITNTFCLLQST